MGKSVVMVKTNVISNDLKYNDVILLTYKIEYPVFSSSHYQLSLIKLNKYYEAKTLEYQKYCENELFNMAVEQYKGDLENNFPVRVYEALVVYTLTYNSACILSLYFDKYEFTGGAHGNTLRYSQTWNLQRGGQIKLNELFNCPAEYKAYIFKQAKEQIEKEPDIYFADYEKLILKTFNENNFYCTPEGLVLYYQQYDIAPYSSGIREFLIPYTDCVKNPAKQCFSV